MFCPQCGVESSTDLKFCRSCGANLRVIGKALSLSDAIARSDSVPAKIKDLVKNIKIEKVTDEVARAMEKMNKEIVRSYSEPTGRQPWWIHGRTKTPEQRRERHLTSGMIKFFSGGGLSIFLYFLSHSLVLRLPPDVIAKIPFEIDPVVRVLWLIGLIPMLSGLGHILAGFTIRRAPMRQIEFPEQSPLRIDSEFDHKDYSDESTVVTRREPPESVTDRTTNILEH